MKNKKAQLLSIFLSACILGTSAPVNAADFYSDAFSADDNVEAEPSSEISEDLSSEENSDPADSTGIDTQEESSEDLLQSPKDSNSGSTSDASDASSLEEEFNAGNEEETFSDSDGTDDFSSGEEGGVQAGILDGSVEAQMAKSSSVIEADIPVSNSLNTTCTIYKGSNLENQNYSVWSSPVESYLTTSPDGSLMRVQSGALDGKLLIEYSDSGYNFKKTMTLDLPLPVFGAFYETNDNYYILTGANNTEKDNTKEVYRVSKYSKDWKSQGSCSLFGANTTYPFDAGSARMASYGNYLFIRTCHEMYGGHQANVTFSVDTSTMSVVDQLTGIQNSEFGYVSHSFNQFIQIDNGTLLGCDHGDAYPRAITVLQYPTDISSGSFVPQYSWSSSSYACKEFDLMTFPGSSGNNYTGASLGGFEYSDSSYLVAGNYDADNHSRNVFVSSVSKSGGTPVVRYFSDYAGTSDSAATPHLVKTGSNSFVLLWSSQGYVYYTAIDGTGQQAGSTYKMAGNLSDCAPSVINGKLIWYAWKDSHNTFYEINLSDLSSNHATRVENGHKYVYGTTIENYQVYKTCRVCGTSSKAVVPSQVTASIAPSNSSFSAMKKSEFLTKELSYRITASSWFPNDFGSDSDFLYDCIISSSDESVISVNQTSNQTAVLTPKKSGKITLTVQSKYNPDAVFTSELYVDLLSEDVFTISRGYIGSYNGTDKTPTITIYRSGLTLQKDVDYTITTSGDTVNAGTFTMTFTGIGKYAGSVTKEFTIDKAPIYSNGTTCTLTPSSCIYDGKPQEPKVTISKNGVDLVEGRDFTVEYQNNTTLGNARAGISGIGNYYGYFTTSFSITYGRISNCDITVSNESLVFDGTEKKPAVTVTCNGNTLTQGQDYTLYYHANTNAGSATVTITGKGRFSGSVEKAFQIQPADLSRSSVDLSADSFTYDGTEKKPSVTVKTGNRQLTANSDYTVSFVNNTNAGSATVTVTGKGNYSGSVTKNFTISAASLEKAELALSASSFTYDGTEKKPDVTVTVNKKQLKKGTDYTVSYDNNTNIGTASVTITGKGNYSGTVTKSFQITARDLSKCEIQLSSSSFTYSGTEKKPKITVTSSGKELVPGTDYTVSYRNNINAGTASVVITGKGSYTGTKTASFQIARAKAVLTAKATALTLTQSSSKTAVIKSKKTDGKITCKSSNSKIVKISGTSIIPVSPGQATVTIQAAQGVNYKAASAKILITVRPLTVSSVSLKSTAKGQANISWKPVKSVTAYQIQYSTSSSFKSAKTITAKSSSKSTVLKKLSGGKKYYIRIRTYKTVSKKNYYSTWSKTSSVKVK